ncbi:DHA2 family efflux MFS transporter permease subunit [Nocardiopsis sp. RSe5-2]|uniref:DHA2 family efflux MFS transporter permease subunit n=1 Tax=Nocardiopsis endophytica TaxID=3018445 RepID=A0ABT4U664_9ACTN|nr:DHA2 family efflux MFS transporter permease subunit [Nocardiopsis endophytica]MDA2812226.1 DHA2 family efflux MFS transporter permease subunit [Nocardiopsis endophytica]
MRSIRGNPWAVLAALCLGFFMTLLDLTIVNIAIPDMIRRLGAAADEVLWVVNVYTLALAVLIITSGRLGDLYGQRRLFIVGVASFTAASVLCGLAPGAGWLIAARAVQGVGAAVMMPQTMALLVRVFPPERRGTAMGVWGAVAGLATVAGPTLGGLLVTAFDWRFIFFVNIPFGAIALVLGVVLIPPDPKPEHRPRFDPAGVALATGSLGLLAFALVEGERFGWGTVYGPISIPLLFALSAVLFAALIVQQRARQGRDPLVPFGLFGDRNFSLMSLNAALVSVAMIGHSLLFTIYLQSALGMTALAAGLTMAPMSVLSMVAAPVVGRWVDRLGGKYLLMGGFALFCLGLGWLLLAARPDSRWWEFALPLALMGLAVASVFGPMNSLAMYRVDPRMAGAASGVLNTLRQLGSVLGGAVVGALMQASLAANTVREARTAADALPPQDREAFITAVRPEHGAGVELGGPAPPTPPEGMSGAAAERLAELAGQVFSHAFTDTFREVGWVAVGAMAAGLAATAFSRNMRGPQRRPSPDRARRPSQE